MPVVSIIIPHYKTKQLTSDCLASIYKHVKDLAFEVLVIDNASSDGSADYLKNKFPHIRLIKLAKNYGFGLAINIGAKKAKGKHLCILNSDTLFVDNWLSAGLEKITKNAKIGLLAPRLISQDNKLQYSGGSFPNLFNLFCWSFFLDDLPFIKILIPAYHLEDDFFYQKEKRFDWLQGACWLIKKDLFDNLGGFDEKIFMYGEDVDFCLRLKKTNRKILYVPKLNIVHLEKKELSLASVLGEYYGLVYFFSKHRTVLSVFLVKLLLLVNAFNRMVVFGILLGNGRKKEIYQKAFKWFSQNKR